MRSVCPVPSCPVVVERENLSECDSSYRGASDSIKILWWEAAKWAQVLPALQVLEVDDRKDDSQAGLSDCFNVLLLNHWHTGSTVYLTFVRLINWCTGAYLNAFNWISTGLSHDDTQIGDMRSEVGWRTLRKIQHAADIAIKKQKTTTISVLV